jgi:hypothetical protein
MGVSKADVEALTLTRKSVRWWPGAPMFWSIPLCAATTAYGGYPPPPAKNILVLSWFGLLLIRGVRALATKRRWEML